MKISEALRPVVESGTSKYSIARLLGVQPIMIDNYLQDKIKSPKFSVCRAIYINYGVVVFPYNEEELQQEKEQTLMDFNNDNNKS